MFGDEEVIDLDGKTLTEKTAVTALGPGVYANGDVPARRRAADGKTAKDAAVAVMPGAFGKFTTLHMFQWVKEKGYSEG